VEELEVGERRWGAILERFERMVLDLSRDCWFVIYKKKTSCQLGYGYIPEDCRGLTF
jgi:hypothetical protein